MVDGASERVPPPTEAVDPWAQLDALNDAPDVIYETDLQGRITWISDSVKELLGWTPIEVVGTLGIDLAHPDDRATAAQRRHDVRYAGLSFPALKGRLRHADGSYRAVVVRARPRRDDDGNVVGATMAARDVQRREALVRSLITLSRGTQVLVRATDEHELLTQMCRTISEVGGYPLVWYGELLDDHDQTVGVVASAGEQRDYLSVVKVSWGEGPLGQGPTGRAARSGIAQVANDLPHDPSYAPWSVAGFQVGFRSAASLPVTVSGVVDGVLVVYAADLQAFDAVTVRPLQDLAADLGYGIARLRAEEKLGDTLEDLVAQRRRLQATLDSLIDPHVMLSAVRDEYGEVVDFVYADANTAACRQIRMTYEQLVGSRLMSLFPHHEASGLLAMYAHVVDTGQPLVLDGFRYEDDLRGEERLYDIRAVRVGEALSYTWRDVTDQKMILTRLRESEERYRLLAENASDIVLEVAPDATVGWVSESVYSVLGWLPERLVGLPATDLVHPDDVRDIRARARGRAAGWLTHARARLMLPHGGFRWMSTSIRFVDAPEGLSAVLAMRDVHDEVMAQQQLDRVAGREALTGLAPKAEVLMHVDRSVAALGERPGVVPLVCVGLDGVRALETHRGAEAKDHALATVAGRLVRAAGPHALVARGDVDELLVLLPAVDRVLDAYDVADALRMACRGLVPLDGGDVTVTVSVGLALASLGALPARVVGDASRAIEVAQARGTDRIACADASVEREVERRASLLDGIRTGLSEGEFELCLAPVASLSTKAVEGYVGRLRWAMSGDAVVDPGVFLPIALRGGLVAELDLAAVAQAADVLAARREVAFVAVTVSAASLAAPTFVAGVRRAVGRAGVPPQSLRLVVDERELPALTPEATAALDELVALGVPWWVGGFGSGSVSVPELVALGAEGVSLDPGLLAGLHTPEHPTGTLVAGMGALVRALGLRGTVFGVETARTASLLRRQGWEYGSGPLYGPAVPGSHLVGEPAAT